MRHRKLVINGSLAVVVVTLAGLGYFTVASSSGAAPTAVRTATVAQGDVTAAVSASGNVTSAMNLGVSFTDCTGSLTTISVKPGQVVSQGQTLATVDPTKAQTALNNAQAQLAAVQPADYTGGGTIGDGVLTSSGSGGALTVTPAVYSVAAVPAVGSASVAADEAALLAAQNTYKGDLVSTSAVNVAVSNTKKSVTVDTAATAKAKQDLTTAESANPQVPSDISAAQAVLAQAQRRNMSTCLRHRVLVFTE
jgi:multidrug efflux pump subunit AcrA (membrane-fusion protein)